MFLPMKQATMHHRASDQQIEPAYEYHTVHTWNHSANGQISQKVSNLVALKYRIKMHHENRPPIGHLN
jgi:hypothetical protein